MTPAHYRRHSRYMPNFTMVYQSRYSFDIIMNSEGKHASAVKTMTGLVDKFDYQLPHGPDLANFAEVGTTESKQLFLLEENVTADCPYETL
jgi:FPC/CPF motif-containing protein YcgG